MSSNGRTEKYTTREFSFEVYLHEKKLTAIPLAGVRPLSISIQIERGEWKTAVWRISFLNLEALELYIPRNQFKRHRVSMKDIALAAMIAVRSQGVDPHKVAGWATLVRGSGVEEVREAYDQWLEKEEVNNAT